MQLSLSSAETCITNPCDHLVYVVGFRVISALEITIPYETTSHTYRFTTDLPSCHFFPSIRRNICIGVP